MSVSITGTLSSASFNSRNGVAFSAEELFKSGKPPEFKSDWLPDPAKLVRAGEDQYLPTSIESYFNNPSLHRQIDRQILGVMAERMSWLNKELLPVISSNDTRWNVKTMRILNTQLQETPLLGTATVMQQQISREEVIATRYMKAIPFENDQLSTVEGRRDLQKKMGCWVAATLQKMAYAAYAAILATDQRTPNDFLRQSRTLRDYVNTYHQYKLEFAYAYKGPVNLQALASRYADLLREANDDVEPDILLVPPTYGPFIKYRSPLQYRHGDGGSDAMTTLATDKARSLGSLRVEVAPGIYDENERQTLASLSTTKTRVGAYSDFAVDLSRKKPADTLDDALKFAQQKNYIVGTVYDTAQNKEVIITVGDCMKGLSNFFTEDGDGYKIEFESDAEEDLWTAMVAKHPALGKVGSANQPLDLEAFLDLVEFTGLQPCETQVMDSMHLIVSKGGIGNTFVGMSRYSQGEDPNTMSSLFTYAKYVTAYVYDQQKVARIPNQLFAGYICGKDSRIIDPKHFHALSRSNYNDEEVGRYGSIFMTFQPRGVFKVPEFIFSTDMSFFDQGEKEMYPLNFLPLAEFWTEVLKFPKAQSLDHHLRTNNFSLMLYHNGMSNFYRGIQGHKCSSQTHVQFETDGTREVRNFGLELLPGCKSPV